MIMDIAQSRRDTLNEITMLLAEAAALSHRSVQLAAQGNVVEALALEEQADALRAKARSVAHAASRAVPPACTDVSAPEPNDRGPATRQVTITSLNEIGVPVAPRAIAEYARARFDTEIDYRALASLRRDERRAWGSPRSHRPTYIVPALEGRRFLPMRGKLALSIWPLELRLIGPWSERVDYLHATGNLARQLAWLQRSDPTSAQRFTKVVAQHAATIPGAIGPDEQPNLPRIEEATRAEIAVIEERDREWRGEAAARARKQLSEEEQLWGAEPPTILRQVVG